MYISVVGESRGHTQKLKSPRDFSVKSTNQVQYFNSFKPISYISCLNFKKSRKTLKKKKISQSCAINLKTILVPRIIENSPLDIEQTKCEKI